MAPVWFITACTSGFGRHIALEALQRGHKVIATARDASRLSDLKDAGAITLSLDVTWPLPKIQAVAKEAHEKHGPVTHLVNSAGYLLEGAVEEITPEEELATFNTNVFGMLNVSRAFIPYLRTTPGEKVIANFGSIGSWRSGPGYTLYSGTKWACSGITEGMYAELAPFNITATIIEAGYFRTGFLQGNARVKSKVQLEVYDNSAVGAVRRALDSTNNNQRGDVVKGCRILVDILTRTGVAEGKEIPMRIPLGSDSPPTIREKMRATEELLREWEGITTMTDHDDVV